MVIGVLSLQGDFQSHETRLQEIGFETKQIRQATHLAEVDGLVIPGGESTTLLKLLDEEFRFKICELVKAGAPTLVTCAGLILIAKGVSNPAQESLNLIDVDVARNAYGRQVDSFIETLHWTKDGEAEVSKLAQHDGEKGGIEGIFIRAPRISRVGKEVNVLIERDGEPVLVKSKNIIAATFHPELSSHAKSVHRLLTTV